MHRQAFDHSALFYQSEREYVDSLVPFVCEGLDQRQPVLLAVPGNRLASLRDALADAAADVTMADITEFGRNPGRILAQQLAFVERHPRPARPHHHRTGLGRPKCVGVPRVHAARGTGQHRVRRRRITGLCPYDASCLDDSVLADVRLTHPQIWLGGSRTTLPGIRSRRRARPLQPTAGNQRGCGDAYRRAPADLAGARKCGERYGRLLGMSADRVADLLLVATELATNSLDHAGGRCQLAFWYEGGYVVCEARDMGHWADPLAGRRPPASGRLGSVWAVCGQRDRGLVAHVHDIGRHDGPRLSSARGFCRSCLLTGPHAA